MNIVDLRNEKNILSVVKEKLQRHGNKLNEVEKLVENIIIDVKENKDKALLRMMKDFDKKKTYAKSHTYRKSRALHTRRQKPLSFHRTDECGSRKSSGSKRNSFDNAS